ncbi:large conductance mechanosensitive channel protein MscL [Humidisolicoccus flavus]|uniref:large conductance mechanosensitive channel protein MscL n=1 Tax=Humidisolicoccus flavus TaxID=3111414 RepID=UPI00324C822D
MSGFKAFLLRGNVIELAVAVVIGGAFTAIVTAVVNGIINPVIAALFDAEAINEAGVQIMNGPVIAYGLVIGAVIQFLLTAAVVYFGLVLPMKMVIDRQNAKHGLTKEEAAETDVDILHDIRDLLRQQNGQTDTTTAPKV